MTDINDFSPSPKPHSEKQCEGEWIVEVVKNNEIQPNIYWILKQNKPIFSLKASA